MHIIHEITTYKVTVKFPKPKAPKAHGSLEAAAFLWEIYRDLDQDREHFAILALNRKHQVHGVKVLFSGGAAESRINYRTLFVAALRLNAVDLVLCHNHPSGDPEPSPQDLEVTNEAARIGRFLGIPVPDHIILGAGSRYFSFADRGMMPEGYNIPDAGLRWTDRQVIQEVRSALATKDISIRRAIRQAIRNALQQRNKKMADGDH